MQKILTDHSMTELKHIMITMPMPPNVADRTAFDYYQCFIRHMNNTPFPDDADKVADAIDRTANDTDSSPAYVARLLVGQGLRAPKSSFPDDFIYYVDGHIKRHNTPMSPVNDDIAELVNGWDVTIQHGKAPVANDRKNNTAKAH